MLCTAKELVLSEKAEQRGSQEQYIIKSLLEIPVQWYGAMLVGQETEWGLAAFCCSSDSLTGIESATRFWELKMLWESRLERLVPFGRSQVNQVSLRAKIWGRSGFSGLGSPLTWPKEAATYFHKGPASPKPSLLNCQILPHQRQAHRETSIQCLGPCTYTKSLLFASLWFRPGDMVLNKTNEVSAPWGICSGWGNKQLESHNPLSETVTTRCFLGG